MYEPTKTPLLDQIHTPDDLRRFEPDRLRQIADELRQDLINAVAQTGAAELDEALDELSEPPVESPFDRPGKWYVVHTYAGYENKVKSNLESRISSMNMEDRIYEVVIPMEEVIEVKNGKRVPVQRKVFPGSLLCLIGYTG